MWRRQALWRDRKQSSERHTNGQGGLLEKVTSEQKPEWRQRICKDKALQWGPARWVQVSAGQHDRGDQASRVRSPRPFRPREDTGLIVSMVACIGRS